MRIRTAGVALALFLAACGGGGGDTPRGGATSGPSPVDADITLLFMGNSHTSSNGLSTMVADMVRAVKPGQTVASVEAPGWMFLDERVHDAQSMEEAKELIRMSRVQHAVPVMFPEWPLQNVAETLVIYDLHVSIAQAEPACVAPVGQAWDLALIRDRSLPLYADDGNHSRPAGAFLAALVLFATITGGSPLDLPDLPQYPVDAAMQEMLRGIAAETVATVPPRMWCPNDPV
jgi:hypothetical protein